MDRIRTLQEAGPPHVQQDQRISDAGRGHHFMGAVRSHGQVLFQPGPEPSGPGNDPPERLGPALDAVPVSLSPFPAAPGQRRYQAADLLRHSRNGLRPVLLPLYHQQVECGHRCLPAVPGPGFHRHLYQVVEKGESGPARPAGPAAGSRRQRPDRGRSGLHRPGSALGRFIVRLCLGPGHGLLHAVRQGAAGALQLLGGAGLRPVVRGNPLLVPGAALGDYSTSTMDGRPGFSLSTSSSSPP